MAENKKGPRFIPCPHCGQPTALMDPPMSLINMPRYSMLVATHENLQQFDQCKKYLNAVIEKVGITWKYIQSDPPENASLIMQAPAGLKI